MNHIEKLIAAGNLLADVTTEHRRRIWREVVAEVNRTKPVKLWIVYEDCSGMDIKGAFWTEAEAKAFAKAGETDLIWHVEGVPLP
jgi:hypothetical protein